MIPVGIIASETATETQTQTASKHPASVAMGVSHSVAAGNAIWHLRSYRCGAPWMSRRVIHKLMVTIMPHVTTSVCTGTMRTKTTHTQKRLNHAQHAFNTKFNIYTYTNLCTTHIQHILSVELGNLVSNVLMLMVFECNQVSDILAWNPVLTQLPFLSFSHFPTKSGACSSWQEMLTTALIRKPLTT